jgi:hypothetical protein
MYQGQANQRHKVKNRVATFTLPGTISDPDCHLTEFFVHENNWAYMSAQNQTGYALTQARIQFWGFRYVLTALTSMPAAWTPVPAAAHL